MATRLRGFFWDCEALLIGEPFRLKRLLVKTPHCCRCQANSLLKAVIISGYPPRDEFWVVKQ